MGKGARLGGLPVLLLGVLAFLAQPVSNPAHGQGAFPAPELRVFVSILPQLYFVERVGGGRVQAEVLVQPGQDPHTFDPTPRQMASLARTQLYLRIGLPFENSLVPKLKEAVKNLAVVDTSAGVPLLPLEEGNGPQGLGATDPHIWLDPKLVMIQARTIRDSLIRLDPPGRLEYEAGYARFQADLERLDGIIRRALAPLRGKELFVFHPAFGYFAAAYGMKQVAVETGGKSPSARQLTRLIEQARRRGVRVIFVQSQFSQKSAQAVAEAIGGAVIPLDPLARDYLRNLEEMARRIEAALR